MDNATKQKLWKTADQLRSNMDAAEYKHVVLGLIFLKYISDSFSALRNKMKSDDYYKNNPQYIDEDMRDYCTEHNAFLRIFYALCEVFYQPLQYFVRVLYNF